MNNSDRNLSRRSVLYAAGVTAAVGYLAGLGGTAQAADVTDSDGNALVTYSIPDGIDQNTSFSVRQA